jgi:magnesium transporter
MTTAHLSRDELLEAWPVLSDEDRVEGFELLTRADAEELFHTLDTRDQYALLTALPAAERRLWIRALAPDDAADVIQHCPDEQRQEWLGLLDESTRTEVAALLAYAEDNAGGLMSPRYARLRPEMSVGEAISYLRRQTRERVENIYYAYVLDPEQQLLGVVSLRELIAAPPDARMRELMHTDLVAVTDDMDQEAVSHVFAEHDLTMVPVVDAERRMKGVVTVDDIVDVVREEAAEDIQKIGGVTAFQSPYLQTSLLQMIRKRAPWLIVLFIGQTFTFNVIEHYEARLAAAAVLIIFIPLILSSGGNAGSQAATLVVRSVALDELRMREWWRVAQREVIVGLLLGGVLALLGIGRILLWRALGWGKHYTDHYWYVAAAVGGSVTAVVLWGTVVGAMLPLLLRSLRFDPASASTPLVATLCDVTGLVIYFSIATVVLRGVLL